MDRISKKLKALDMGGMDVFEEETVVEESSGGEGMEDGGAGRDGTVGAGSESRLWMKVGRAALFALVFLTPLFFLPVTQGIVEINKQVLVAFLIGVALISFLISVIERRRLEYPFSATSIAVLALVVVAGVSTVFSRAPEVSLYGRFLQADSFLAIVAGALLFFLSFYFWRREDLPRIGTFFFVSMFIASVYGLLQLLGIYLFRWWPFTQSQGFNTFGSLFAWGIFMCVALACAVALPFDRLSRKAKVLVFLMGIPMVAALFLLNYQVLWIALAFVFVVLAAVRYELHQRFRVPVIMAVIVLTLSFMSTRVTPLVNISVTDIRPAPRATFDIARHVLSGWRAFLGSGPATFSYDFTLYRPMELNQTQFWTLQFFQGHNFILTALATMGILGFLAVIFLIGLFARRVITSEKSAPLEVLSVGVSFLIIAWFIYPALFTGLIFAFLGLGLFEILLGRRAVLSFEGFSRRISSGAFLVLILVLAFALSVLYQVGQKYIASVQYGSALQAFAAGDANGSLGKMSSVVGLDSGNDEYWRAASQMLIAQVAQGLRNVSGTIDQQTQAGVAQTLQAAQNAANANPLDATNWTNLASAYESLIPYAAGADSFAEQNYRKASELDPQNPQIPVNIARVLMTRAAQQQTSDTDRAAKLADAQKMLDAAIALKADYAPANFLQAQLALLKNNPKEAIQNIEKIKATNYGDPVLAYQLGLFYYQNNLVNEAQKEFERAVSMNPNYADARYFLGLTYDKNGLRSSAIDQFETIQKLDPANASQLDKILMNLHAGRSAFQDTQVLQPATSTKK